MQVHGPSGTFERPGVHLNTQIPGEPFVIVQHASVRVNAETTAECDVMIAAWTEARRLLAEAQTDHAIAADLDEQTAPDRLYVVWEVLNDEPRTAMVVTDPMQEGAAKLFAEREAPYFPGRLEALPARPEDLAPEPPADRVPDPAADVDDADGTQ